MGMTMAFQPPLPLPSRQTLRDVPFALLSLPRSRSAAPKRDLASVVRMPLQRRRRRQSLLLLLLGLLLLLDTLSCFCDAMFVSASEDTDLSDSEPRKDDVDDLNAAAVSADKSETAAEGSTGSSTSSSSSSSTTMDAPIESLSESKSTDDSTTRHAHEQDRYNPKHETSLLLVHRDSPYAIKLEAVTAYRLRQSQQQYNNENDAEVDLNGNIVQTNLPKVKRGAEMDSTGKTLKKPSTNEPSTSTNQTQTTRALVTKTSGKVPADLNNEYHEISFETIPLRLAGDHVDMAISFREQTRKEGGFMILGDGPNQYADLGVGSYKENDENENNNAVVSVQLWSESLSKPKRSKTEQAMKECLSMKRQFELQSTTGQVLFAETIRAGAAVWMTPSSTLPSDLEWCNRQFKKGRAAKNEETKNAASRQRWQFMVNSDGTISPIGAEHLVIGLAPHPEVTLVHRPRQRQNNHDCKNDPKVLIFDSFQSLWLQKPAPLYGTPMILSKAMSTTCEATSKTVQNPQPLAMVPLYSFSDNGTGRSSNGSSYDAFGFWDVQRLGIARLPSSSSSSSSSSSRDSTSSIIHLHALDNGKRFEFVLHDNDGRLLVPFNLHLEDGVPVRLVKYNVSTILHDDLGPILDTMVFAWSGNATWIINDDQSISPLNAPYLALGLSMGIGGAECKQGQWSTFKTATTGASEGSEDIAATASQDRRRAEQLERLFATGTIPRQENIHSDHHKYANETYRKPVQNSRAMALFVDYILEPQMLWSIHEILASCGNATTTSSDSGSSSGIGMSTSISSTMDSFAYILHAVLWSVSLMGVVVTLLVIKRIPWMIWGIPIVWIWMGSNVSIAYNCGVIVVFCSTMYKRWKQRRDGTANGPNHQAAAAAAVPAANAQAGAAPPAPPPPPAAAPVDDNEVDLRLLE